MDAGSGKNCIKVFKWGFSRWFIDYIRNDDRRCNTNLESIMTQERREKVNHVILDREIVENPENNIRLWRCITCITSCQIGRCTFLVRLYIPGKDDKSEVLPLVTSKMEF